MVMDSKREQDRWELTWENYPDHSKVVTDGNLVTFVVGFGSSDLSASAVVSFQSWLEKSSYSVALRGETLVATSHESGAILFRDDHSWVPIRCQRGRTRKGVRAWLDDQASSTVFIGEVIHGVKRKKLTGFGTLNVYTGIVGDGMDANPYPYKFIELRSNRRLLAKMLVSHFNAAMNEAVPTMEILEVVKEERGKGIGSAMIGFVEEEARQEGFDRVWGTDAERSMELLEKLGYEFDAEEGRKHLE